MSEFKTKILGLAALATAFAGLSYGQAFTCAAGASGNPTVRAEGETELVSDLSTVCTFTGAPVATTGSVFVTASVPVTGRTETAAFTGSFNGNSDIILQVIQAGTATQYYQGTITGSSVSFSGVAYPGNAGTFTLQVSNTRLNASAASNPQLTEALVASYAGPGGVAANATLPGGAVNVGYVLPSLSVTLLADASNRTIWFGGAPGSSSVATCTGNGLSGSTAPNPAFTLQVKELFANAFKTQAQENGSLVIAGAANSGVGPLLTNTATLAATNGQATQATQLQVALTNVPASAVVYLPVSVTSGTAPNTTTFSLQGSVSPLTSPASLVGLAGSGVFGFTPSSGNVTAVYAVTSTAGTGATTGTIFSIPTYIEFGGNTAPVQSTAVTVLVSYLPAAAVTGNTSLIPTFAVSTTTPTNTITITACNSTLLFPYITNVAGFETGIAIANTTTDNVGNTAGTKSSATPTPGTCTLNFYGSSATQPAAVVTPTIGVASATTTTTPVWANTLTLMGNSITNFTGYAIASCNFLDAHGFVFILANPGTTSQAAEGYLAVTLGRGAAGGGGDGTALGN